MSEILYRVKTDQKIRIRADEGESHSSSQRDSILYVVFGSRTGNSKAAAELANDYAAYLGITTRLLEMKNINAHIFSNIKNVLLAVSTHGEGDPPAVAESFYNYIHSGKIPSMKNVRFSILALGDSSYRDYCKTGKDFRKKFLEMGGEEIYPLTECDIDYEKNASRWAREAVKTFEKILPSQKKVHKNAFSFEINKNLSDYENAFYAKVLKKNYLTRPGYGKSTLHLSLSMDGFTEDYQPGDSFGVYMNNSRPFVDKLIKQLGYDGTTLVEVNNTKKMLKEALVSHFELTLLTPVVIAKYAGLTGGPSLNNLLNDKEKLSSYCKSGDILDLVSDFPARLKPDDFLSVLRNLAPRLYSVASSSMVFPGELHLTASLIDYSLNGRRHRGVCSTYFEDRLSEGDSVPVFLEANEKFRLPEDDTVPVIMICTGTGIAPFRAFLQQREYTGATGENWLFFGDRHKESDFLYKEEMMRFLKSGILNRHYTAFSRDQKEKIYVQHYLLEYAAEIFNLIQNVNATVYLCGNKRYMGQDVKKCLENIIAKEGNMKRNHAADYLQELKRNGKLQMDLY